MAETKHQLENNIFDEKLMKTFIEKYQTSLKINNPETEPIIFWSDKLDKDELTKERENYFIFAEVILKDLLGYDLKEDIKFEQSPTDISRPVEFTLQQNKKDYAVMELKGTGTKDLNKRYNRQESPIDQATVYASAKEETKWAIVSNYDEFRLFDPNSTNKYISFKFRDNLNEEILKKFLLVFSKPSLIELNLPSQLLENTQIIERKFEDSFYKLFSETRAMLIKELEYSNNITHDEAIHYAQLILNRYIFICFAEDEYLLPRAISFNTIALLIENHDLYDYELWNELTKLFRFIDKGNPNKNIPEFNGGLFQESLRFLKIRDYVPDHETFFQSCLTKWKFKQDFTDVDELFKLEDNINPIFKNLLIISSFDFTSELNVNILGHIFENSIGDIEELKNDNSELRKRDGVFYTPEFITDYICRNTILPYLSKTGYSTNIYQLINEYMDDIDLLDDKIKNIKILDISCGSGAFLNKATEILLKIHRDIHDIKFLESETNLDKWSDKETRRKILIDNIYGVDVNEESVEISKLAMFLNVARRNVKLPDLDKNIKCGNSLVNDKTVDPDTAFNWETEFSEVFDNGGFDIIIGNPPYVNAKLHSETKPLERKYINDCGLYECLYKKWDLYIPFMEHSLNLLKENGYFSMIIPYPFVDQEYGKKLREKIYNNYSIEQLVDLTDEKIFKDATVKNLIPIISKSKINENIPIFKIKNSKIYYSHNKRHKDLLLNKQSYIYDLEDKIQIDADLSNLKTLGEYCYISVGMVLNAHEKKAKGEFVKDDLISDKLSEIHIKEYTEGKYIDKYRINTIKYLEWDTERVPNKIRRPTFNELYTNEKILINKLGKIKAIYGEPELYCDQTLRICILWKDLNGIKNRSISSTITKYEMGTREELEANSKEVSLKYLLAIINSKMGLYLLNQIRGVKNKDINPDSLRLIPIPSANQETQNKIISLVDELIDYNREYANELNSFAKWLKRKFDIILEDVDFTKYDFEEFLDIVVSQNDKIDNRKNHDLLEQEFTNSLKKCIILNNKIDSIDNELNKVIFELYGLNDNDIQIVLNG